SKDMRVTANQFGVDMLENISNSKVFFLTCNLGVQVDLEQEIAEFFDEFVHVILFQCLQDFVGLLNKVTSETLVCLLAIQGAAIGLATQAHGDIAERLGKTERCQFVHGRNVERAQVIGGTVAVELV